MRIPVFATIASAIAMCIATACSGTGTASGDAAASAFHSVDPGGWRYSDTIALPLSAMTDSVPCRGDVVVSVRHSNDYPYSNIWLEISGPDGAEHSACVELADVYGRWYGHGMGLTFERSDTVVRGIVLGPSDTLRVHHNMRLDTLPGIEQIGIFFIKH